MSFSTAAIGRKMTKDEARLRAEYDLTYREIVRKLKASAKQENDEKNTKKKDIEPYLCITHGFFRCFCRSLKPFAHLQTIITNL